jgi:hypothetical protein
MKTIKIWMLVTAIAGILSACEVDNYPGPNAALSGNFYDVDTDELVAQDIIRGTTIDMLEHGYDQATPQYHLRVKNDGTYAHTQLFSNTYTVQPVRGNFVAVAPQDIEIKGNTTLDFRVLPYIRVLDANVVRNGDKIVATFRLQQNVVNNVRKIGLYAHYDPTVGEPFRLLAAENNINAVADPNQVYILEIDIPSNSTLLISGRDYFFRIGALIDIGEAKANYAAVVKIPL